MFDNSVTREKSKVGQTEGSNKPTVFEMVTSGFYKTSNLTNPKDGIKGYNIADPLIADNNFKIKNIARSGISKYKAGFTYTHLKHYGKSPAPADIPGIAPWGTEKYFKMSADNRKGVLPQSKKVTMTE